jgi:hypothetical protein
MDCADIERWERDLLLHCDCVPWWRELYSLDNVVHGHRSHQRHELHVYRHCDERSRCRLSEHRIQCSCTFHDPWRADRRDGNWRPEHAGTCVMECAGLRRRGGDHDLHGHCDTGRRDL